MYRRYGKRLFDILLAGLALIVMSPFLGILAIAARRSSPGPAIFRQARVGRDGVPFQLLKFRSMPVGTANLASDRIGEVTITPFGRFIRRTNLDELPQLVNILRGDMSIVGPRPALATQTELVEQRRLNGALACRPGLTGLAQINSFDGMTAARKAEFDGRYAQNVTLFQDVSLVINTFAYLMRPPPVY